MAVDDWFRRATPARREEFLAMVRAGQLEVAALPLNQTPTLDRRQWQVMLRWLPEELWQQLGPRAAVQNDVNGTPRAGALAMLDRGVRYLFTGINDDSGGCPIPRPSAFWWKMPDGRRMFVWLSYSYPMGFYFFEPESWRRGPVPAASDTRYRNARPGDFLRSDEASLRKAHAHLVGRLRGLEAEGYRHPTLLISITNEWRMDNDPPFPALADFVAAWNHLGLEPSLRLTTVSRAMERMEKEAGPAAPEYEGEWTDWWANGGASGPREVAASREAKRLLAAAESPVLGEPDPAARAAIDSLLKDLCLFDEHTWGNSDSVAQPFSLETLGQYNEKARLAYRPRALAQWLLAQRLRTRLAGEGEGLFLVNTTGSPVSGWVTMPASCLREAYQSVEDPATDRRVPLVFEAGWRPFTRPENPDEVTPENTAVTFPDNAPRQAVRFWAEGLEPRAIRWMRLSTEPAEAPTPGDKDLSENAPCRAAFPGRQARGDDPKPTLGGLGSPPYSSATGSRAGPKIDTDASGWPVAATWEGMKRPLFAGEPGGFLAVSVEGFAPRWVTRDIWGAPSDRREALRSEQMREDRGTWQPAVMGETPHTIVYTQRIAHPRLRWGLRRLELWRAEPRARLTFRLDRLPSEAPEAFFVGVPLGCGGAKPVTACGGVPFRPFDDQIPGTCRDYFSIDSWAGYAADDGHWLWTSRDAPLVTFGPPRLLARQTTPPAEQHQVWAMVYNNFWYTNFVADVSGAMEFQFDLAWREKLDGPSAAETLADSLTAEPQVVINPSLPEDPIFLNRQHKP